MSINEKQTERTSSSVPGNVLVREGKGKYFRTTLFMKVIKLIGP